MSSFPAAEWATPEALAELRRLWATAMTTREIAAHIGVNKNQLVGKAHRLGLPERPNLGGWKARLDWRQRAPRGTALVQQQPMTRPRDAPKPVIAAPRPPSAVIVAFVPADSPCCWPIGEPRTRTFRYCDVATTRQPYCPEHRRRAYTPIARRHD